MSLRMISVPAPRSTDMCDWMRGCLEGDELRHWPGLCGRTVSGKGEWAWTWSRFVLVNGQMQVKRRATFMYSTVHDLL